MPTPELLCQGSSVKAPGKRGALGQIFTVELDFSSWPLKEQKFKIEICVTMAKRPERTRQDWEMVSGPVLPAPGGRGGA